MDQNSTSPDIRPAGGTSSDVNRLLCRMRSRIAKSLKTERKAGRQAELGQIVRGDGPQPGLIASAIGHWNTFAANGFYGFTL